jgi:FkbM family methyltransferase
MIKSILRKVYHLIFPPKVKPKKPGVTYPFVYTHNDLPFYDDHSIKFNIHNAVENYRLALFGDEKDFAVELVSSLNEDDILFDIGSSVGLISILSAKKLKKGNVISFEPDPENYKNLESNFSLNGLSNYKIAKIAVGNKKEKLKLYTAGSGSYSPSLKQINTIENWIEVDVEPIDTYIVEQNLPNPTVVKIDIEGAEMMALQGMSQLLKSKNKPRLIYLEVHPDFLEAFNTSTQQIFDFISEHGYKIAKQTQRDNQILCNLIPNE